MRNKIMIQMGELLAAIVLSACGTTTVQTVPPQPRTLNVSGSGQVFLTPDVAYISIGIHTEGENASETVTKNTRQAQALIEAIKSTGVEAKDVQTSNFSIYPQQRYNDQGEMVGTYYVVENTVYVTVRDLAKIGSLLDTAVKSGANNIYGIQFDVADKTQALSEGRKKAVENARTQAEELAQAAGVTLGAVQSLSSYGGYPQPVFLEGKGGGGMAAAEVPISPGQISLTVDVNIVYEIK